MYIYSSLSLSFCLSVCLCVCVRVRERENVCIGVPMHIFPVVQYYVPIGTYCMYKHLSIHMYSMHTYDCVYYISMQSVSKRCFLTTVDSYPAGHARTLCELARATRKYGIPHSSRGRDSVFLFHENDAKRCMFGDRSKGNSRKRACRLGSRFKLKRHTSYLEVVRRPCAIAVELLSSVLNPLATSTSKDK